MDTTPGHCLSCGFLGKRAATRTQGQRARAGVLEVEWDERARPDPNISFPHPLGNAAEFPEFVCLRQAASLPDEITAEADKGSRVPGERIAAVFARPRGCQKWWQYVPGLDPKEHLMERRLRELEDDRKDFQRVLSKSGYGFIYLGLFLAAAQVLTVTPDSVLYKWGAWVIAVARWFRT